MPAALAVVCPDFVNASPTIKNHSFSIQKRLDSKMLLRQK